MVAELVSADLPVFACHSRRRAGLASAIPGNWKAIAEWHLDGQAPTTIVRQPWPRKIHKRLIYRTLKRLRATGSVEKRYGGSKSGRLRLRAT